MDCADCERLAEEERLAAVWHQQADVALAFALAAMGSKEAFSEADLDRWKKLDDDAADAYARLRQVKRRTWEHWATH